VTLLQLDAINVTRSLAIAEKKPLVRRCLELAVQHTDGVYSRGGNLAVRLLSPASTSVVHEVGSLR